MSRLTFMLGGTEQRPHFVLKFGEDRRNDHDCCSKCGTKTTPITAYTRWVMPSGSARSLPRPTTSVRDEISAHFCLKCERITSLSFIAAGKPGKEGD